LLVGEELVNQAKQLGVYDINKYVKDTTDIIEKYEAKMNRVKGEIKRTLKNLVKYATKEISNIDMSYIKESRLDNVSTKLEDFMRDFNYRKRYLDRVLELYNYLQDNATDLNRVKNHWNDISNSYPINTQRYSRYDKLIRKAIKKYESEVEE
jgi:GTP1/Obg family GTP-binding protein